MAFKNDAFLWYNVGEWSDMGLAIPNYGDDVSTQNSTILNLTSNVGRNLQNIMVHPDSRLRTPPSINTLMRIHKLCTRIRSILVSRAVPASTPNMEPNHAVPSAEAFLVFPTPFFKVRNPWLKEYAQLVLLSLTEAFQHQENSKPIEISEAFAGLFGQYFDRIYRMMSIELLKVDPAKAIAPGFTLTDLDFKAYNPSAWFTSTEMIDTPARDDSIPTEDDLLVLTNGIPVTMLPVLGRYPGVALNSANPAPAAKPEAFFSAPGA